MIDAISAFFSGLAILVAIYAANTANKSADATIRSANCSMIFDEYLIKKIPQSRTNLDFDGNGYLRNGNKFCDVLSEMNFSALFYKYDDNEFFSELTKQCGNLEDMIVEAGNHPLPLGGEQKNFWKEVQNSLESIYKLIDKKRTGKKNIMIHIPLFQR